MEEFWLPASGNIMVGLHRDTFKSGKAFFEYLRIEQGEDGISYWANPGGRAPTEFKLKEVSGLKVVFENPDHDFPQRIIYRLESDTVLIARVEGEVDGELRSQEWKWYAATVQTAPKEDKSSIIKSEVMPMKRVTGIGGLFFKTENPEETKDWYKKHLGIESGPYAGVFEWRHAEDQNKKGFTVWGPFSADTEYFQPSEKEFMFNYRVDDLEKLLEVLEEEGVEVVGEMEEYDYGKFGWIMDPNGQKIELWEPNDEVYEKMADDGAKPNKSS